MVVENNAGASGTIAADAVAKAPADGYTLLQNSITTHGIGPHLFAKLPYDPVKDFARSRASRCCRSSWRSTPSSRRRT